MKAWNKKTIEWMDGLSAMMRERDDAVADRELRKRTFLRFRDRLTDRYPDDVEKWSETDVEEFYDRKLRLMKRYKLGRFEA